MADEQVVTNVPIEFVSVDEPFADLPITAIADITVKIIDGGGGNPWPKYTCELFTIAAELKHDHVEGYDPENPAEPDPDPPVESRKAESNDGDSVYDDDPETTAQLDVEPEQPPDVPQLHVRPPPEDDGDEVMTEFHL